MSRMTGNIIVMCRFRSRSRLWRLSQLSTLFQFYLVCVDSRSHGLWCLGPCVRKLKLGCNGKKIKCFLSKSTSLPEAWNIQGGGISLQFSYNKYKVYTYIQLHSYVQGRYKLLQFKPNILKYLYQFRKVCGHVNECSGYRFCLFLRIYCYILKLFRPVVFFFLILKLFRQYGIILLDFKTVTTVLYFRTVPTLWYF